MAIEIYPVSYFAKSPLEQFVTGMTTGADNMIKLRKNADDLEQQLLENAAKRNAAKGIAGAQDYGGGGDAATTGYAQPVGDGSSGGGGGGAGTGTGTGGGGGGGAVDYSEPGNGFLKDQRQKMADEIKNTPGLSDQLLAMAKLEDDRDPAGPLEALFNRAAYTGQSLQSLLHSGFYGPINRGQLPGAVKAINADPALKANLQRGLDYVISGSNRLQGATDQGMAGDPNAGTTSGRVMPPGGTPSAIYNDWGGGPGGVSGAAQWRQQQQSQVKNYVPPQQTAALPEPGTTGIPAVPHYGTDLQPTAPPALAPAAASSPTAALGPGPTYPPGQPQYRGGLPPTVAFNSQGVPYNPQRVGAGGVVNPQGGIFGPQPGAKPEGGPDPQQQSYYAPPQPQQQYALVPVPTPLWGNNYVPG